MNKSRRAFTLVEMLVVIGLIVVLISILVPTISRVRKSAYDTKTKSILSKIGSAAHAYFLDFRAYPGPLGNNEVLPNTPAQPYLTNNPQVTSSENLVLALLGGIVPNGQTGTFNAQNLLNPKYQGPMSLNPGNPKRYSPYINVEPGELSNGKYMDPTMAASTDSDIPEFMDGWPSDQQRPIIYLRANVGATAVVDDGSDPAYSSGQRPQYRWEEAVPYTQQPQFKQPGHWDSWFEFFASPNMQGVPRGKDAFILAAQGISRDWGRKDVDFSGD